MDSEQLIELSEEDPLELPSGRRGPVILCSLFSATVLICGGVLLIHALRPELISGEPAVVRNEQYLLDEVNRLQLEGTAAFKAWGRARQHGDRALEDRKHREAVEKLGAALDQLNAVLENYRDAEGELLPGYVGYETQMSEIAVLISDLTKDGRIDPAGR